jgi:hypothetical protein
MNTSLAFYIRWLAIGCFVAFVTIVCLLTWDGTAIWVAWLGLTIEAAITGRVVMGTFPIKPKRHPSTVRSRQAR